MIPPELSAALKEVLANQEHLFEKLKMVAAQYDAIDYDESGLYFEEEAAIKRRWEKLASKLSQALEAAQGVMQVEASALIAWQQRRLTLHVTQDSPENERFDLEIGFSHEGLIEVDFREV